MGFIDTTTNPAVPVFYNVVHAVGQKCPNMRDDVKLVQYLLKAFYEKAPDTSKPNGVMTVDGLCGPTTRGWINRFEMDMTGSGQVALDGRIDRVRDHSATSSISQTYYALVLLNRWTIKFNPGAWIMLPNVVHLENPENVPPPSWDVVNTIATHCENELPGWKKPWCPVPGIDG